MGKYDTDGDDWRGSRGRGDRDGEKRSRRWENTERTTSSRKIIAIVFGGLILAGLGVLGVYKLVGKKLPYAKSPAPAGWQQFTSERDGFRGYFPGEPVEVPVKMNGHVGMDGRVLMEHDSMTVYTWEDKSRGVTVRIAVNRYKGSVAPEAKEELMKAKSDPREQTTVRHITWSGRDAIDVTHPMGRSRTVYLERSALAVELLRTDRTQAKLAEADGFFDNLELLP